MTEQTMQSAQDGDEEEVKLPGLPANTKNYMTPACYRRLLDEREHLVNVERPQVVSVVSWAASNGDRSENGDYQYGKRRLREIDRRIRFLNKRVESAEVVDPETRPATDQVFFGATVTYENLTTGEEHTIRIVGIDEADPDHGDVSWISPIARVFSKSVRVMRCGFRRLRQSIIRRVLKSLRSLRCAIRPSSRTDSRNTLQKRGRFLCGDRPF